MPVFDYIMIGLAAVACLAILIAAVKTKKPLKVLLSSSVWGVVSLFVISLTGSLTGFAMQITPWSLSASAVFGIPGVICMALTKMVWVV